MTIEEAQQTHLEADSGVGAIAGDRGYPWPIPEGATYPAWAYQRVSGPREQNHDGASGMARARIQYTCTANTYGTAKGLANAIRSSLDGYKGVLGGVGGVTVEQCWIDNEYDGYNQSSERKTVRLDVMFYYIES